jgi:hypothetical protein
MKLIRRLFAVVAMSIVSFGVLSTTTNAATPSAMDQVTVGTGMPSAGICCMYFMGRWVCFPC